MEIALKALRFCVLNRKADDAGDDSCENLLCWLKGRKGSEERRDGATYLVQRYETLRDSP